MFLSKIKFDGIITHNVLEHLFNPIETTDFLLSLLQTKGKLIHSTACFDYVYEITRFHAFFYTGDSVKYIVSQLKNKDITYSFIPKNEMVNMQNAIIFSKK